MGSRQIFVLIGGGRGSGIVCSTGSASPPPPTGSASPPPPPPPTRDQFWNHPKEMYSYIFIFLLLFNVFIFDHPCFHYVDSSILLLPKCKSSDHRLWLTALFASDQVSDPEDRFVVMRLYVKQEIRWYLMSCLARRPVLWVSDQV